MPATTAIHLTPKNFETIALQTDGLLRLECQQLYSALGSNYAIVRDNVDCEGTPYETYTMMDLDYMRDNFDFDETDIFKKYTKIVRKGDACEARNV